MTFEFKFITLNWAYTYTLKELFAQTLIFCALHLWFVLKTIKCMIGSIGTINPPNMETYMSMRIVVWIVIDDDMTLTMTMTLTWRQHCEYPRMQTICFEFRRIQTVKHFLGPLSIDDF